MRKLACALVVLVLAGSCGGSGDDPAPGTPDEPDVVADGSWVLTSGRGPSGALRLVDGYPVTLEIEGAEASGRAACNSYAGGIAIAGDSFETGELSLTEIACPDPVTESEAAYLEALQAADTIAVDGDALTLTGPETELSYRRAPPVDTESLVDTTWILTSLVEGSGPDATTSSARPARLRLDSGGTFEGTTGCRGFSGDWVESGDRIVFESMAFEGGCSGAGVAQDGVVISVLGAGFSAKVKGRQLTLTAGRGGLALVYDTK